MINLKPVWPKPIYFGSVDFGHWEVVFLKKARVCVRSSWGKYAALWCSEAASDNSDMTPQNASGDGMIINGFWNELFHVFLIWNWCFNILMCYSVRKYVALAPVCPPIHLKSRWWSKGGRENRRVLHWVKNCTESSPVLSFSHSQCVNPSVCR